MILRSGAVIAVQLLLLAVLGFARTENWKALCRWSSLFYNFCGFPVP